MEKNKLFKPNQLIGITSNKDISVIQRKIYNVFLKKVQEEVKHGKLKETEIDIKKGYWFTANLKKTHYLAGVKRRDYKYIEDELDKLMGVIATIKGKDNPTNWKRKFSILPEIERTDEGDYEFKLPGTIVLSLKKHCFYTPLELMIMREFKSKFSTIIYEFVMRYKHDNNPKIEIPKLSIDKLRELTSTTEKYKRFQNFKKRVIKEPCEEIFQKTNLKISYELEKSGRSYKYIKFHVKRVAKKLENIFSQEVLDLFKSLPKEEKVETSKDKLKKYLDKYSKKRVERAIEYCKKNNYFEFWKYFSKAIREDYEKKIEEEKLGKEKLKTEKRKKQREKELKLQKEKEQQEEELNRKADEILSNLTSKEKKKYKNEYNSLTKSIQRVAFQNDLEIFILAKIKDEIRK